jgi:hypothetical protein
MPGGLLTDLCELNMAGGYLRRGMTGLATFSLFPRASYPDLCSPMRVTSCCRRPHDVRAGTDGLASSGLGGRLSLNKGTHGP